MITAIFGKMAINAELLSLQGGTFWVEKEYYGKRYINFFGKSTLQLLRKVIEGIARKGSGLLDIKCSAPAAVTAVVGRNVVVAVASRIDATFVAVATTSRLKLSTLYKNLYL